MAFNLTIDAAKDVWPPLATITDKINEQISKVDYTTSVNILSGFDKVVNGETYHFSFNTSDQINFLMMMSRATSSVMIQMAQAIAAASGGDTTALQQLIEAFKAMNSTATVSPASKLAEDGTSADVFCTWQGHKDGTTYTLSFTLMEFIAFAMDIGNTKQDLLSAGWTKKDKLRQATTESQLLGIVSAEKIDVDYRAAQDIAQAKNIVVTD